MKLSRKLIRNFTAIIIFSIVITSIISNIMINIRFEYYLINERENKYKRISQEISQLYVENELLPDEMELKHYALSEDINIIIKDLDGSVLYDTNTRKKMNMGTNMHQRMLGRFFRSAPGQYQEKSYYILSGDNRIGSLVIGYIDNAYLTESALLFKGTLYRSFLLSSFITIIIGFVFSIILSRRLTNPLIAIRNTANRIQTGDLKAQVKIKTDIVEIQELSQSLNYLANTLDQQENIRKRYASDISHELRTPLTTLSTHLEAIMDGVWEANEEHLNILMEETKSLRQLVDNLKDSFIENDYDFKLNKTHFNLSKELTNIITAFGPIFQQNNSKITSTIEGDILVFMDREKFKQIMNNLLSNSIRYLPDDGEVIVRMEKANGKINLSVSDNGMGMEEEKLPFIFDRFYRVDISRNKSTGGMGLGPSIVKSIIEAHGGSIRVNSSLGKGTHFLIEFPS